MGLKETTKQMEALLGELTFDLRKAAEKGNKAAAQRVRTGSIHFAKIAKQYRKESVAAEKRGVKKAKKSVRKKAVKKVAKKAVQKRTTHKKAAVKKRASARLSRRRA